MIKLKLLVKFKAAKTAVNKQFAVVCFNAKNNTNEQIIKKIRLARFQP